ncbi:MAG: hypothetical protein D6725_03215 [Planctomycetota bacterium]|nr:MAG: hypothetical protein D6725_03215 [Planctomycetota bacterium]
MIAPARLSLRLTPLLDLLLIVIFAQYMDLRQSVDRQQQDYSAQKSAWQAELETQRQTSDRLRREKALLEKERRRLAAEIEALREERDGLQAVVERLTDTLKRQSLDLQREADRRRQLAETLKVLFAIPESQVRELLKLRAQPESLRSERELQELAAHLKRLREADPETVLEHFTTLGELLKRCDLWRLYLAENGTFRLQVSERRFRFMADSPEGVVEELFRIYKALPEPKSLVIVLFSYGDVRFAAYDAALRGLPAALARMQADRQGRTRFEYTVLGFDPDGPPGLRSEP